MSEEAPSAQADVSPGDKIAGYRLEEQIGQGGMAVVYRAHDERLDRRVALKLLSPGLASDAAFRTRFIRESRSAAAVDHPNIIPVYDAGDANGILFIAMRYVQGGDVRALIVDGQPVAPARVWSIITQVAAALDAAHAHNLIHRDVKPANMLLDATVGATGGKREPGADDQREHVYLSDFGISKQTVASHLTSTGQFVGTLDYIAPEQIEGQAADGRSDQYSLACAAFELLSGGPPFRRDMGLALINAHLSEAPPSLSAKVPGLAATVDQVFARAMAKSPAQRYETCAQFAADLGRALGLAPGQAQAAPQSGGAPKAWPATELAQPVTSPEAAPPAAPPAPAVAPTAAAAAQVPTQAPQGPWPATGPQVQPGQWPAGGPQAPTQAPQGPWPATGPQVQPGQWPAGGPQPQPGGTWPTGGQYNPYGPYPQFPPGGPGAPGGPGWQQPPPKKRSAGLLVGIVAATVAVAVAAVGIAFAVTNGKNTSSPSPVASSPSVPATSASSPPTSSSGGSPSAASEAAAVNSLLTTSAQSRISWDNLVNDVGNCYNLGYDISQISKIADQRSSELNSADGLQTGAIPNGGTLKAQLMQALQISLTIDNDYLAWARQQSSSGCTVGTGSSYYQDAASLNPQATADKNTFLGTWDPIAQQYGFPQYSADQI